MYSTGGTTTNTNTDQYGKAQRRKWNLEPSSQSILVYKYTLYKWKGTYPYKYRCDIGWDDIRPWPLSQWLYVYWPISYLYEDVSLGDRALVIPPENYYHYYFTKTTIALYVQDTVQWSQDLHQLCPWNAYKENGQKGRILVLKKMA